MNTALSLAIGGALGLGGLTAFLFADAPSWIAFIGAGGMALFYALAILAIMDVRVSRIVAGAGLLVALCLPAAVVLAVAPKRWPQKTEQESWLERQHQLHGQDDGGISCNFQGQCSTPLSRLEWSKRPDLTGFMLNDGVYRGPDFSYRDCNLQNGHSPRPTC